MTVERIADRRLHQEAVEHGAVVTVVVEAVDQSLVEPGLGRLGAPDDALVQVGDTGAVVLVVEREQELILGLGHVVDAARVDRVQDLLLDLAAVVAVEAHPQVTLRDLDAGGAVAVHAHRPEVHDVRVELGLDAHVVHLALGVYGYGTASIIPEGYLRVRFDSDDGREVEQEILYPVNPGSVYHMTKTQDQLLFAFYNKNDGTRVTDLHQGIVWGTPRRETRLDERLINRFDYDGDYGTVLNRFLMQAAIGYPLTVHGTGGGVASTSRTRALSLAAEPAPTTAIASCSDMTECHARRRTSQARADLTGAEIDFLENPARRPRRTSCTSTAVSSTRARPDRLADDLLTEVTEIAGTTPIAVTARRSMQLEVDPAQGASRTDGVARLARAF